jgi:CubicO group peptidase (beta-lactamase class C family)
MTINLIGSSHILFLLMLSMTMLSNAQAVERPQVTPAQINEVVTKLMEEKHIPGLSIAVSMAGGKVIEENYGLANVEYKQPVEKDSIFEIGSISKTFTAIGILMLQEEVVPDTMVNLQDQPRPVFDSPAILIFPLVEERGEELAE